MEREQAIRLMQDLLRRMVEKKGSDLFITAGFPPAIKVDGEIRPQSDRSLSPEQSAGMVRAIMNDRQTKEFDGTKECNFAISPPGIGRFRVSAFIQQGFTGAVLRTINAKIPTLEELELPPVLKDVVLSKRGFVILVGGTGSGKSTSLAAMGGFRNEKHPAPGAGRDTHRRNSRPRDHGVRHPIRRDRPLGARDPARQQLEPSARPH